jgi:hypothetical protein
MRKICTPSVFRPSQSKRLSVAVGVVVRVEYPPALAIPNGSVSLRNGEKKSTENSDVFLKTETHKENLMQSKEVTRERNETKSLT